MNKKIASFFIILFVLVYAFSPFFYKSGSLAFSGKQAEYENDAILVKFKNEKNPREIKVKIGQKVDEALRYYQNLSEVEYAEPNYIYKSALLPSDTYFSNQWYLQKIKAPQAWNEIRESPEIIIAVLDSGVQINHPDLKDNIWVNKKEFAHNNIDDDKNGFINDVNGWDFVNDAPDPSPKFQEGYTEDGILHGTIIAGIAAASGNNAAGIAGVTWKARIMPLKVLNDKGEGSSSKVIKAIDYSIANGADIINLSFVGFGYSKGLEDAVKRAYDAGVIIVAASGNEISQGQGYNLDVTPAYPACLDGPNGENRVIAVAATDTLDQKAPFSSFGGKCIDISAPGISIFSTVVYSPDHTINDQPFNKYYDGYWAGTSVAVPIISSSLALIEAANPALDRGEVLKVLLSTADNINKLNPNFTNKLGSGRVNLWSAISQAKAYLTNKTEKLLVAPQRGYPSYVKITDQDGKIEKEFLAFDKNFKGGVNLASGDINGDGIAEIIAAAGPGGGPHIRIFNLKGELMAQWFAFKSNFRGGVRVASADVNNNGSDEIIAVQASAGNSEVKIFNARGQLLGSFYAYDSRYKGGLNIAAGDLDNDGEPEIVTALPEGKIPEVRIFKAIGVLQGQFLAYPKTFRGGVKVAIANVKGGTRKDHAQIITAPESKGGPHVKLFDRRANLQFSFFAYSQNFRGGVNLSRADVDNDGLDEIITGAGPTGAPHVRVFKANGVLVGSFYASNESMAGGVNVGGIKMNK